MNRTKLFFYLFFILAIFSLALGGTVALSTIQKAKSNQNINANGKLIFENKATLQGNLLYLAFARTESEHRTGLSFQSTLKANEGLLFIFKESSVGGIWMKDMNFPIDVLWLDEHLKVNFLKENFLPSSYPEIVYPLSPSRYILEIPAGFVRTHQIKIGDSLKIF